MKTPYVVNGLRPNGIGNMVKSLITGLAVDSETTIKPDPSYSLGLYDTVFDSKHIYKGGPFLPWGTYRFLILKDEENDQVHTESSFSNIEVGGRDDVFSTKVAIEENYDRNRISEKVRNRILNTIHSLIFLPCIHSWVHEYTSRFNPETTLGISVRTWTAQHEQNTIMDSQRRYSFNTYAEAIREELHSDITHVVLSLDNINYANEYLKFISSYPVSVILLKHPTDQNDTQYSFVKMLVLSKCNTIIANKVSTFTDLVFWFGDCKPKIRTVC